MTATLRQLVAEFLATFALVFIGAGSVIVDAMTGGEVGLVGVALAHGVVLAVMVTITMPISGGHVNPAVTFGLWLARKIDARRAGLYVVAQLAGAVAGALLLRALFPVGAGDATSWGLPRISPYISFPQAVVIEAILTLFLVSAVFGTAVSPQAPKVGGFGIGLVLVFDVLAAGPLTGAAMNPARAFGPAVASNDWHAHAAYWAGPLLGAAVAALVWGWILATPEDRPAKP
ncbi:MAG: aquaporin [Gemmatimonadetes bacterium]|nr:aquaporin [Gemmatimonadota bacterium]